jgi:heptosyltransferase-2
LNETIDHLRKEEFDYIIDLHHNLRTGLIKNRLRILSFSVNKLNIRKWMYVNLKINRMPDKHLVDRNLEVIRLFDVKDDGKGLDYFIPEEEELDPGQFGKEYADGFIALAIGAQHQTKKLPTEKMSELLNKINHPVIILGGPEDSADGDKIKSALPEREIYNASGKLSINQSASLVRQSKVVITHDTGMMHIAAAFQKKILSLWGSTVPDFGMYPYRPDPDSVIFEVKGLSCRPCSKIGYQQCPKRHFKCMQEQNLSFIAEKAGQLFTGQ